MLLKQQNNDWQLAWPQAMQRVFITETAALTVADFLQQIDLACRYIDAQSGNNVLLFQRDIVQFTIWFIALCQRAKHIVLAPDEQPETLRQLAQHSDWRVPDVIPAATVSGDEVTNITLSARATVSFFTSGSTGQPKLIGKTLSQLLLEVQTLETQFGSSLAADAVFCGTVSTQHIYGLLFRLLWPLCSSRPISQQQISYLEQWQAVLQRGRCVFVASPAHLARFDDVAKLASLSGNCQRIFSSGGPLADDVPLRYIASFNQAPTEVFGSTETGGIAFRQRTALTTPWQVFPGIRIGQTSQQALQLWSPYINTELPYVTQDKVVLLSESHFTLLGRMDRIAKIEEKRLSLPEMEQFCARSELVAQSAAVLLQQGKTQLALVVVLTAQGQIFLQQHGKLALNKAIKQHLLQRFEAVVLPRKFRYVSALPYNQQGKLPLQHLEALFFHD